MRFLGISERVIQLLLEVIEGGHVVRSKYSVYIGEHPIVHGGHGGFGLNSTLLQNRNVILELQSAITTRNVVGEEDYAVLVNEQQYTQGYSHPLVVVEVDEWKEMTAKLRGDSLLYCR